MRDFQKLNDFNTYFSSMPTIGREYEESKVIKYDESLISEIQENFIGWKWIDWYKDRYINILLDFGGEAYISNLRVHLKLVGEQCDYQEILLSARTEDDSRYRVVSRHIKYDEKPEMVKNGVIIIDMPVNKKVRCLNLQLLRGEWWIMPVPKVEVFGCKDYEKKASFTNEEMSKEILKEAILVDEFGQAVYIDYPEKIKCNEDLKRDAEIEAEKLKEVAYNSEKYDCYGGLKTGKNYGATGFFRVEKIDGIWWFITPEGNPFFLKGVDGICYDEMSHYTPLYRKGTTELRGAFEKLPDKEKYPQAYKDDYRIGPEPTKVVDFQEANLIRKYGNDYRQKWADVTHKRLIDWGFNASGKWGFEPEIKLPYVAGLPWPTDAINTRSGIDPFDEELDEKLERTFEKLLTEKANNPLIIGYHFGNEDGWELNDLKEILHDVEGKFPAKKAFVEFIKDRYKNDLRVVNIVLRTKAESFEELVKTDLDFDIIPRKDTALFVGEASKELHKKLRAAFKKYDKNHLFFGATPVPGWRSCTEWNTAYAEYVDVLAFDWYFGNSAEWMSEFLYLDKPILNLEFGYASCEFGHAPRIIK